MAEVGGSLGELGIVALDGEEEGNEKRGWLGRMDV